MPSLSFPWDNLDIEGAGVTLAVWLAISLLLVFQAASGRGRRLAPYLRYLWAFLLVFTVAAVVSFTVAVWILAGFSFLALREFFALVPLRIQDRWAMVGAYLAIPFMTWYIQTDWYGMFIISIPVYAFLVIPALVALAGGPAEGTVLSIGVVDFGLFLFVYCAGHIGYLARLSLWMAILLVLAVAVVDMSTDLLRGEMRRRRVPGRVRSLVLFPAGLLLSEAVALGLAPAARVPARHALILGALIPFLVWIARMTLKPIERDLQVDEANLVAGRGAILRGLRSFLFAGPVVFHYVRYFFT